MPHSRRFEAERRVLRIVYSLLWKSCSDTFSMLRLVVSNGVPEIFMAANLHVD